MEEASAKLTRFLVAFLIGVVIFKSAGHAGFFTPKNHKGRGYSVLIPEGWKKVKQDKDVKYPMGVEVAEFVPEGRPAPGQVPDIYISIFTKKLSAAIWIEDEFPSILASIQQAGYTIKDKGEIKFEDALSKWVVYQDTREPALILEFYMVTDNNIFYKIQYAAPPEKFNVYRKSFEELRESFKFRFSLY